MSSLHAHSLPDIPEIEVGADLAQLIVSAARAQAQTGAPDRGVSGRGAPGHDDPGRGAPPLEHAPPFGDGDVIVIAHKAVSKAEGALVVLAGVQPGERALRLAAEQDRDPRAVQVVLDESQEILRTERGVLICRTHHGFVCANAGVDASNAPGPDTLIVLPRDPDASARCLRARLRELTAVSPAVLITDSFGRAWRHGQCDTAIGCAGMCPLEDWRGRADSGGRELQATWLAVADAAAATADLARAKDSREPVVIIKGLERFVTVEDGPGAVALLRPPAEDLFL
ncbi:MAG TPA: coenzyme F420-0:L-glutamate ligase [Solirubrobacteraceae bacterium]|nr:coenzyme F420-0:L-glutamate ligase [Solirubrobacteraceae bacterium]